MRWSAADWNAALAALRRGSAAEVVAMHEAGAISAQEVLNGAWQACHGHPELRAELVRQFRANPDEYVVDVVGGGLEELAAQSAARAASVAVSAPDAEPGAVADTAAR